MGHGDIPQIKCLAENLYHEARGEGVAGMRLVGMVTLNRGMPCSVVTRGAFSWVGRVRPRYDSVSYDVAYKLYYNYVGGFSAYYYRVCGRPHHGTFTMRYKRHCFYTRDA
jgi:hypothetical protein